MHNSGDDFIFEVGWVLEGQCIVVMENDRNVVLAPDVEHCAVDDLGEGALRIIGDRCPQGVLIVAASEEPSLAAGERY